ncbi:MULTISPECIES: acetyl-CoA acetyltransferase [unclassified Herbaspirillum]|uniref:acetyl-CoA acetyltransferase n=1 Tax=unclassified Herbaspirillum TaxID=2624150 RepID=UPI000E2EC4F6|nr:MULTISPECIES: acetyl-CoA acetyltransferase [unclassified Herbaspirillum]RFB70858.1 thiolase domain-containing protein [Herbaspirillum sp. 3R-3a1]TFI08618.1 thiolase domain-containing protein [Herbaspirillum sp. 3R11]TFI15033.1 thiolase domain-containing protein [Herbaspirillum sp. 3R-11]TFI25407.1 thiolase domain-containing protein [Herbaspirillum sp. 3C11]
MAASISAPCITGWHHSKFGKLDGIDPEVLIGQVAKAAILHAGLQPEDIDSIHIGTFNAGFLYQDFPSSLVFNSLPQLRFKPAVRVENACATGSAAIHSGLQSIKAGESKHVLVIAFEKMTELATPQVGEVLLKACYVREEANVPGGFAGVFGKIAQTYFDRYGDQSDALAMIAAKNHKNGTANPYAHMRRDLGYEFCRNVSDKNPFVAGPLKRSDCSLISDGAVAMVISTADEAKSMPRAVQFRAAVHVNDYLPLSRRDVTRFEAAELGWTKALGDARLTLNDLSLVETHDCFTIAELIEYEAMGLAAPGQGARVIKEGISAKDGKLPINPSGGLKSKGHPVGATGVSMHVMAAMQVVNNAGDIQVPNARLAGVFNMGGAAVANYVSILERVN